MTERHSLDISYHEGTEYPAVRAITEKYPSCQWYVSDVSSTKPRVISQGHIISSTEDLLKIIAEVNAHPDLWVDFTTYGGGDDFYHIYVSPGTLARWRPESVAEYNSRKAKYTGQIKEIYDLCTAGEGPVA